MNKLKNFFPLIIFGYNRPEHIKNLILSIKKYKNLKKHKIYYFNDGPKTIEDYLKIKKIKIILSNSKIKFETKIFRKKNIGLSKSIISGVNQILEKNLAAIVIEDDLILSKNAIEFINYYLDKFKNSKITGSISAYSYINFIPNYNVKNNYFTKRHSSWCWGTWSKVWNKINWNKINYKKLYKLKKFEPKLNDLGYDLKYFLWANDKKIINSWAVKFNAFCALNKLTSIQPSKSLIINKGFDGSGSHSFMPTIRKLFYKNNLKLENNKLNKFDIILNKPTIHFKIKNYHKPSYRLKFLYYINKIFR